MASGDLPIPPAEMPSPSSFHFNLNGTLGALFIGLIFTAILFGVTNTQLLIYYQSSTRDPKYMRLTIAFLWLFDTLHLALMSHILYVYMVINFANVHALTKITWSTPLLVIVTGVSDGIIRLYYIWRVWIMSRHNWFLTTGAIVFALLTFITSIGVGAICFTFSYLSELSEISWLIGIWSASAVVADLWTTITLCFFLVKNKTGIKMTDSIVNVLIVYVISTGLLTAICAIISFVTYVTIPQTYVNFTFLFILPKLYFNAILAMLNARERLQKDQSISVHSGTCANHIPHVIDISSSSGQDDTSLRAISTSRKDEFRLEDSENENVRGV